jgi:Helix-turn-helix domain
MVYAMDMQAEITQLRERLERLERERKREIGSGRYTTQNGAARYLGISTETLRRRHDRGVGPPRSRKGSFWVYAYADLDEYIVNFGAPHSEAAE